MPSCIATPMLVAVGISASRTGTARTNARRARSAISMACSLVAHALDHDHELVAADPADQVVRAEVGPQPAGHRDEQLVADAVAERVVDELEPVEVEEQDGDALDPSRPRSSEHPGEVLAARTSGSAAR